MCFKTYCENLISVCITLYLHQIGYFDLLKLSVECLDKGYISYLLIINLFIMRKTFLKLAFITSVIIMTCCSVSCHRGDDLSHILKRMKSQPIDLCLNEMTCLYQGRDTLIANINNPDWRLVIYVDSAECSPCMLDRIYYWNTLIESTQKRGGDNVQYVFILAPKEIHIEETYSALKYCGLKNVIYLDSKYVFRKRNQTIPEESEYHIFLINKTGYVTLVGNPLTNEKIKELLDRIIIHNYKK